MFIQSNNDAPRLDANETYILNMFDRWLKETGANGLDMEYIAKFDNEFVLCGDFESLKISINFKKGDDN